MKKVQTEQLTNDQIVKEYLPLHQVRNIKNAELSYSRWGHHEVIFEYQKLLSCTFVKMGVMNADDFYVSRQSFSTKKQALHFIKLVNVNQL